MGRSRAAAGELLLLIAQNIDVLAGPVVSLAYPLYASIRAIETRNAADDQQWLTYWVLYSMITLFELTFYTLVDWIPFWSYLKLIITCWLVIPQFRGATYVYQHYVRPFYTGDKTVNIWYVPSKKDDLNPIRTKDDILIAGDKYIHEYRPDETIQYANAVRDVDYRDNTFFYEDEYANVGSEANYRNNTFFTEDDYVY